MDEIFSAINLYDKLKIKYREYLKPEIISIRMKRGISYYRNPLIMQMLVDYGYADKIGRGIMSIIKYHEKTI